MFKTGVHKLSQLRNSMRYKTLLGAHKKLSIGLYNKCIDFDCYEQLQERILLYFTNNKGAYKRTYKNRFHEYDEIVSKVINAHYGKKDVVTIHDMGVSDGRTSVDFYKKLQNQSFNFHMDISDYNFSLILFKINNIQIVKSGNGSIIEIVYPPFVFNLLKPENYFLYPLNYFILRYFMNFKYPHIQKRIENGDIEEEHIQLICHDLQTLREKNSNIEIFEWDVLQPQHKKYKVIRAMNLLNPLYFSSTKIAAIINNFYLTLEDNGLLIMGSNQNIDSVVNGRIYKKTEAGFEAISTSGREEWFHQHMINYNKTCSNVRDAVY